MLMAEARLDVRLDHAYREKLEALASARGRPMSVVVRELIDAAYQQALQAERVASVRRMAGLALEAVPDPRTLADQLARTYDLPDLS
ncbi:MAG: ribbon-helix-helix protein, CopG family [Chloroflexota bacterium]